MTQKGIVWHRKFTKSYTRFILAQEILKMVENLTDSTRANDSWKPDNIQALHYLRQQIPKL